MKIRYTIFIFFQLILLNCYSQSNKYKTIHGSLTSSFQIGDASFNDAETYRNFGYRIMTGISGAVGLRPNINVGMYLRKENSTYFMSSTEGYNSIFINGFGIGLNAKRFFVNKNKFNFYFQPTIGYSYGKSSDYYEENAVFNGINYTFGFGLNWYFIKQTGISFEFGYHGNTIESKNLKIFGAGFCLGAGIASYF